MPDTAFEEAEFPARSLPEMTSEYVRQSRSPTKEPVSVTLRLPADAAEDRGAETVDHDPSVKWAKSEAGAIDSVRE